LRDWGKPAVNLKGSSHSKARRYRPRHRYNETEQGYSGTHCKGDCDDVSSVLVAHVIAGFVAIMDAKDELAVV
jgi:hypothetical protein